jgi:methylmalonyl-CoA epimerase
MIKGINHVGFVVESIDKTLERLGAAFGAQELGRKSFPDLGQTSCIVRIGDGQFELMEPYGEGGVVRKFLEERGQGFHHVSLLCDSFTEARSAAEKAGLKALGNPEDRSGVFFIHPKNAFGVVYEVTDLPFDPGSA